MGFLGKLLNIDLASQMGTNLAPPSIPFSLVYYSGISSKRLWYDNRWLEGSADEPLTFWDNGREYILIEESATQEVGYSNRLDNAWWSNNALATLTAEPSPSGSITDTCLVTTAGAGIDQVREYRGAIYNLEASMAAFIKKGTQGTVASLDFSPAGNTALNIVPPTSWERSSKYFSNAAGNIPRIYNCYNGDAQTGQTAGDNHYWWCIQLETGKKYIHQPILNATGAPLSKAKDESYWAEADVPKWAKNGIGCYFIAADYSSSQLTVDGRSHVLWARTAVAETMTLSISGADNKPRLVGSVSGTLILGDALTFSLGQTICFEVVFDNGTNSTLKVSGATSGNGTFTGAQTSVLDGDIYLGMTPAGGSHLDGAISRLERVV